MRHILLPALNASAWTGPTGNNTYLLPGRVPTLIDAGVGQAWHIEAIARELRGQPLALVLITHSHSDHVDGIPAIMSRWPRVRTRQAGAGEAPLQPEEMVDAGDGAVRAIHTPGHSPDHCSFLDDGELFCGDLVRAGGTVVIPAGHGGDLSVYLESLGRVRALGLRRLLPGHGPIIDNPDLVIDEYLRHRREREQEILAVLRADGSSTPEHIVSRVYRGLAPLLIPAAIQTVLAHLIKLGKERRVTEHESRWTLDR